MKYDKLKRFLTLPKFQAAGTFNMFDYNYSTPNPNVGQVVNSQYMVPDKIPYGNFGPTSPYVGQRVTSGYMATLPMSENTMRSVPIQQNTSVSQASPSQQSLGVPDWLTQLNNNTISLAKQRMNATVQATTTPITPDSTQNVDRPKVESLNSLTPKGYSFGTYQDELRKSSEANMNQMGSEVKPTNNTQNNGRINVLNPYGGVDPFAGFIYGAYQAGQGNAGQASLGFGRGLLGLARQGFSAYGAGRANQDLLNSQNNQPVISTSYMQDGGEVSVGKFLSGKYTTDSSNPNIEVEAGEHILNSETGVVSKVVGETHEKGGVKTNLPDRSQVLSDHTKIGAKTAQELSKELDIKVKAKNTFAEVLDKYSKKIGVDKNIEEGEKLIEQTENTLRMDETETKKINMDFIQEEMQRIEQEKKELNAQQQEAFQTIFQKQEAKKGNYMQTGGETMEQAPMQENQEANPDDIVMQVQQMMAQGASVEEVVNGLLSMGYNEEQASQIIQASQTQEQPQMQAGGQTGKPGERIGDFLKSAQAIAILKGVDPPNVDLSKGKLTENWTELQNWMVKNAPEEVISYFDSQPLTNKGMDMLLKNKKGELKKIGVDTNRNPESFSLAEKRAIQEKIPLDRGFLLEQFADGKADWRFPITTANTLTSQQIMGQGNNPTPISQTPSSTSTTNTSATKETPKSPNNTVNPQQKQGTRNVFPMLATIEGMAPSAALIPRNDQIRLNRIDPVTRTPEASIAAINNQANFVNEQAFLSNPNLAQFLTATNLGTTQQSVNKAIAETDAYNAQAIVQANQYNANAGDKEQLTNINLANNYEQRLFKTISNQEEDWRRYLLNKEMQNKQNWMDVNNLNLNNAMYPNYQSDGSNVYFSNPKTYSKSAEDIAFQKKFDSMTDAERAAYLKTFTKQDGGYVNQTNFEYLSAKDFVKFKKSNPFKAGYNKY